MPTKKILQEYQDSIFMGIPGLDLIPITASLSPNGKKEIVAALFQIDAHNYHLQKSPYFYEELQLVHFTPYDKLKSIIESQSVWLFNINHLEDPREFTYGANHLRITDPQIEHARMNFHIMSFCDKKILSRAKRAYERNMWELYGDKGKGIAIVFSIENDPIDWFDFHLSEVKYGQEETSLLKSFSDNYSILDKSEIPITTDYSKLCVFHKSELYTLESEVRLIFDYRTKRFGQQGHTEKSKEGEILFPKITKAVEKEDITYLKLPIFFVGCPIKKQIPMLKIQQIKLGPKYNGKIEKEVEEIKNLCEKYLGYTPDIDETTLTSSYWG